ncbi:MAG: M4 family metallopeptidase, partial [Planctomycetaceae bacterium]
GEPAERASWLIGAACTADPALGTDPQPDHMDRLYDGPADSGGVHLNSGIPNRAFVLVAKALGGPAWERAGRIWYDAMLQLSRTSTFADMATLTAQIAGDRFGTPVRKAVKAAWRKVGL